MCVCVCLCVFFGGVCGKKLLMVCLNGWLKYSGVQCIK